MKRRKTDRPNIVRKAIDARSQLADHLIDPAYHNVVIRDFVQQMQGMYNGQADGLQIAGKWYLSLQVGEVYAVSPEMYHVVEQAASELPDDYIMEHHHLHADHGFLWLPERIMEPTVDGIVMPPTDLLTWHHGTGYSDRKNARVPGMEVNLWARSAGERDDSSTIVPVGSDFLPYGLPSLGWRSYGHDGVREVRKQDHRLSNSSRFVIALQMLMRQELPAMNQWSVPRSDVAGLRRHSLPSNPVTVIDLRRRAHRDHPDAEGSGRHLSQRHIVRGHWARYWVGPTHPQHPGGTPDKVAIYLYRHAHVRGPEDAPLRVSNERVHVVRR